MQALSKILLLGKFAIIRPVEFLDRLEAIFISKVGKWFSVKGNYRAVSYIEAKNMLLETFNESRKNQSLDGELADIESTIKQRIDCLEIAPFTTAHNADFALGRLCYLACRFLKPRVVVETGVAYGVTTQFVLKALHVNQKGHLHSIDLPPLGKDADLYVGYLVPEYLKERWTLHRGASKRILPSLLFELGQVDVFIHDSLHTYRNILRELKMVTPYLSRPSIVIADDIEGNTAFLEWAKEVRPYCRLALKEDTKDSIAGVAVFL